MKYILAMLILFISISLCANVEFNMTYATQITTQQQAACAYAASLWTHLLSSSVPIKVNVKAVSLTGFVQVTIPNLNHNFEGTPMANVWFPTALANSLTGTELNPGEADLDIFLDSTPSYPWYTGTDGQCPTGSIDLVTEIMRGIGYGIGYMASYYITSSIGTYGQLNPSVLGLTTSFPWESMLGYPAIYDCFVCNTQEQFLTDTTVFSNMSAALAAQLTGGNLRFNGGTAIEFNAGTKPVLYAGAYDLGKTTRLNGVTYVNTENVFATTTAYSGTSHHNVAPILLGILADLGWTINTTPLMTPPGNLLASVNEQNVNISWDFPSMFYTIDQYSIERNGQPLAETSSTDYLDVNLPDSTYTYRVKAHYSMGYSVYSDPVTITVGPSDIHDNGIQSPALHATCYPNPFTEQLKIYYQMKNISPVNLRIFNIRGQLVNHQSQQMISSGSHELSWNGKDLMGNSLPSGVYMYQLSSGKSVCNGKIILMK